MPLAHLISPTVLFQWDQLAQTAFNHLKKPFVSAPILSLLDLTRQFIMEEDASDPGVGAVTMKVSSTPVLTTVTPAEQNYEVGDLGTPSRNACLAGVVALA